MFDGSDSAGASSLDANRHFPGYFGHANLYLGLRARWRMSGRHCYGLLCGNRHAIAFSVERKIARSSTCRKRCIGFPTSRVYRRCGETPALPRRKRRREICGLDLRHQPQQRVDLRSANTESFAARFLARDHCHVAWRNLNDIGEKTANFFIGAAIKWRCGDADFQCVSVQSLNECLPCTRLRVDRNNQCIALGVKPD